MVTVIVLGNSRRFGRQQIARMLQFWQRPVDSFDHIAALIRDAQIAISEIDQDDIERESEAISWAYIRSLKPIRPLIFAGTLYRKAYVRVLTYCRARGLVGAYQDRARVCRRKRILRMRGV